MTDDEPPFGQGAHPDKPHGGRPLKGSEKEHVRTRRDTVEVLQLAGLSIRQMARQLDVGVATIQADVDYVRRRRRDRLLAANGSVDVEGQRLLELDRLEQQRSWLTPHAQNGAPWAHRALVQLAARKASLLGLDAPRQVEVLMHDPLDILTSGLPRQTIAAILAREDGEIIDVEGMEVEPEMLDVDPDLLDDDVHTNGSNGAATTE